MRTLLAFVLICSAAEAQSLLGDSGASPYDPPKAREWKRHDRLQVRFGSREVPKGQTAPAELFAIAAEVADVRPNGVLVIEALRRRGAETLKVAGEVAPDAVVGGEVAADRVARLSVTLEGGALSGTPGWLGRLFESAAPY